MRVARALYQSAESDPELTRLVAAWATLPDHVRRTLMAIVDATTAAGGRP
jgi:hypothetical protein